MAKAPAARGFTLSEKRSLMFEQISLYMVFLVAIIAAAISFVALRAVGDDAGLGRAAFLLPIAIDGFGIACSVGIVRSVSAGEALRERLSEWVGLVMALALSILGNVHHALIVGAATLPDYVKIAYAMAIPVIVAYGIHVYGRAMTKGISANVLADSPDEVRFDLAHLGDKQTVARAHAPAKVTRAPARTTTPAPAQSPAQATAPTRAPQPEPTRAPAKPAAAPAAAAQAPAGDEKAAMRALFDAAVAANPHVKPDAAALQRDAGIERHPATPRRWVSEWWSEHEESMGTPTRPELVDTAAPAEREQESASAS